MKHVFFIMFSKFLCMYYMGHKDIFIKEEYHLELYSSNIIHNKYHHNHYPEYTQEDIVMKNL